jgi:hypothetical protein
VTVSSGRHVFFLSALLAGALLMLPACAGPAETSAAGASRPAPTSAVTPPPPAPGPTLPPSAGAALPDPADVPPPTHLSVPAIGVDSLLLDLGLAPDGTAEVPDRYELAGWFGGGGRPGSRGPTVILGHVDSTAGPAVFHRLRDLVPGDAVDVLLADGTVATYAVSGTEQVAKDEFPTVAVFGATTADVLRLVTCTGTFDRAARSYADNLVVTAERVR